MSHIGGRGEKIEKQMAGETPNQGMNRPATRWVRRPTTRSFGMNSNKYRTDFANIAVGWCCSLINMRPAL